jgi:hypothetical protein
MCDIFAFPGPVNATTGKSTTWYSFQSEFVAQTTGSLACEFTVNPTILGANVPFTGQTVKVAFPYIGVLPETVLRFTSSDFPITVGGMTFLNNVGFKRDGVHWSAQPQVDSLKVSMFTDKTVMFGDVTLAQAVMNGAFDDARVLIRRGFLDEGGRLAGALVHFEGHVASVEVAANNIDLTIKSELERLNIQLPRNLIMPNCVHAFLDEGCDPNPPGPSRRGRD